MQFTTLISATFLVGSVMAAGPPAGCRQTNVPHFGGICLCTKTAVITTQATITTTIPAVETVTSTSTLLGPECFPPSF
ncbi:hypothetical protein B0T11DRAFT_324814 [Plectosphaerella cucumerina]|uniref:Antifreeze protein n=1 Tax=Plectosphaerella cucumerina TaxID=40658 RepID=A0A8K0TWD5_9PEZI|nr:hypothetical protein B0T11DRAFT_324814 [Plectosphaerella cucumerina]